MRATHASTTDIRWKWVSLTFKLDHAFEGLCLAAQASYVAPMVKKLTRLRDSKLIVDLATSSPDTPLVTSEGRDLAACIMQYQSNLSREEARSFLKTAMGKPYVYMLYKPDETPFYVGKGNGDRVFHHERDAINTTLKSHKLNTIRALVATSALIGYKIELFETDFEALRRERELIARYGRHDLGTGPLTNLADGGEGPANFSEKTRQRHRDTLAGTAEDGSARTAVNSFFLKLGIKVGSVPIKPLGARRLEPLTPHPDPRGETARQAAALVAMAIGNRAILAPGVQLLRRFELEDGPAVLENGVGRDMLKSGMIKIIGGKPTEEILEVTPLGFASASKHIGRQTLVSYGALMPKGV